MESKLRVHVVIGASANRYSTLLMRSRVILNAMSSASAQLPAPNPTMAVFGAQVQALDTAQLAMTTRAAGTKETRNEKAEIVFSSLESLQQYVQGLCDATPSQATTLIAAAGMRARERVAVTKPELGVKVGVLPGTVSLSANRSQLVGAKRASCVFAWEYSLDGGKTWVAMGPTSVSRTSMTGLPSATTVSFRVSASTTKVAGAWSQVVTLLVH